MKKFKRRTVIKYSLISLISIFSINYFFSKLNLKFLGYKKLASIDQLNKGYFQIDDKNIIIYNEKKFLLMNLVCPHKGCIVNFNENKKFICPCHQAKYDIEGKYIEGPVVKNLKFQKLTKFYNNIYSK